MSIEYRIAFIATDCNSHLKRTVVLAKTVRDLGHRCVFIVHKDTEPQIAAEGFDCRCYTGPKLGAGTIENRDIMSVEKRLTQGMAIVLKRAQHLYHELKPIIDDLNADAIVVDILAYSPAVVGAGVPWIQVVNSCPLKSYQDDSLPPFWTGYGINSDKTLWAEFRRKLRDRCNEYWVEYNKWLESINARPFTEVGVFSSESPYLNLYNYPEELDYYGTGGKGKNWFSNASMIGYNVDDESKGFEIPEKLREWPGKLVYLSIGTAWNDVELMKRFVSLLSNSEHRFIVSKGSSGDEYELPDNMWGENWLPQLQVLPIVDLVLTHAGNNTIIECLYFGKPMIGFPLIGDGYDNAQRLVDMELGVRLDPYECTQMEVFEAMDRLLNDSQLKAKYENISQRMKNSKSRQMSAKLIEDLIRDQKMK